MKTYVGVEPLGTVVFVVSVTSTTLAATSYVRSNADAVAHLEAGLLCGNGAYANGFADNFVAVTRLEDGQRK